MLAADQNPSETSYFMLTVDAHVALVVFFGDLSADPRRELRPVQEAVG